jgi:hypothetical protein
MSRRLVLDRLAVNSPPGPFFSAEGELDRVGGIRRVKVLQVRLVKSSLPLWNLTNADGRTVDGRPSRSERCSQGKYDGAVD